MTIKSKNDINKLVERLSNLSAEDIIVLKNLGSDKPKRTIELSSELFILPRIVDESISHLRDRGFVSDVENDTDIVDNFVRRVTLTSEGEDAKTILPLVEKTIEK